ncbi:MAG: 6-carboxytetrahydropterin synthase [Firmicutes bacterium]|nr:6-carboxytetrahydropterin synthase [Bacillota bacterium]
MPPFRLSLRRAFVADHFHDLPGFVEARHGHNWEAEAAIQLDSPSQEASFHRAFDQWILQLDYTLLNDQPRLQHRNPTAEALAQWLLEDLEAAGFEAVQVRMREKRNYWAACQRTAL